MIIRNKVDASGDYYQESAMVLKVSTFKHENMPDDKILKQFQKICNNHTSLNTIVIADRPEPIDKPDEVRSFIFSARKFFPPYQRPTLILYTSYFDDELSECSRFSGVNAELLAYGNVFLKSGRAMPNETKLFYNEYLGIPLLGKTQTVQPYMGMEYM